MPTTTHSALRYPASTAAPNVHQDIQNLATDLDDKVLPKFANITARNAAFTAPAQGDNCIVAGLLHVYDGAAWRWEKRGFTNATTDTAGVIVVPHGLGAQPTGVLITPGAQATALLDNIVNIHYTTTDSANFVAYVRRDDTNVLIASTQVQFAWQAFV